MNKSKFCILFWTVFLFALQVKAQPKVDATAGVERAFGTVTTKVEEVIKKVNASAKSFQEKLLGDSIKTKYETLKALKQSIEANVAAGKELYGEAQKAVEEGKKLYEDGKGFVEETIDMGKGLYEETMGQLELAQSLSADSLETEVKAIEKQMKEREVVVSDQLNEKIRIINENIDVYEKMTEEIDDKATKEMLSVLMAEAQMLKAQYQQGHDNLSDEDAQYLTQDTEYQGLKEQLNEKSALLEKAKETLKEKGMGLAAQFVQGLIKKSKAQKEAEYNAMADENFVGPDEPLTQASVDRINKQRNENMVDDVLSSYAMIIKNRSKDQEKDEKIDMIGDNVMQADYAVTAQRLQNEQEIQKIKQLHQRLASEIADLKTKASNNMRMQGYKQFNPDKNSAELNMDSYDLTEKELKDKGLGK